MKISGYKNDGIVGAELDPITPTVRREPGLDSARSKRHAGKVLTIHGKDRSLWHKPDWHARQIIPSIAVCARLIAI